MAPNFFSLFFLSLFVLQIQARESQFFSKVTHNNNINSSTKNAVTEVIQNKEESLSKTEQEPNFVPETQTGYGLYGHESGQNPPETRTNSATNLPYKTQTREPYNYYNNKVYQMEKQGRSNTRPQESGYAAKTDENYYYNGEKKYDTEQQYNGRDRYNNQQQGMSDTRFQGRDFTTLSSIQDNSYNAGNGYNSEQHYNGANRYNTQNQGITGTRLQARDYTTTSNRGNNYYNSENTQNRYNSEQQQYNGGNNYYNTERQGMSDTRFMENGKYYYDLNSEENMRGMDTRNDEYNSKGYDGNNENKYEFNTMEEYEQSQGGGYIP